MNGLKLPQFTSACPRDCYSTCSLKVNLRSDGRIGLIEPHPDNKATAEGVCLKGLSYAERVYHPDRLLQPMYKKDGRFEKVSWDFAFDLIEKNIRRIHKAYGPQAVLYYYATGTKGLLNDCGMAFWKMIGGYTTTFGDLCWPAGLEATRLTLGANKHNVPWDLEQAKLIILWGKNAAETNVHQMGHIQQAMAQGATLVVIDPRKTESSRIAHLHLRPGPGTDGALALGLAAGLIAQNACDRDFIGTHVKGFEAFSHMVAAWDVKRTAQTTGVPEALILKTIKLLAEIRPMTLVPGFGLQRYRNAGQSMRAMLALPVITGNIGKPGGGWMYANLQSFIFDEIPDPLACYPDAPGDPEVRRSISTARLGPEMLAQKDPPIKMIWIERGNPLAQNPETNMVLKAIRGLEFRVVIDQFMTDTALEADLVLPAKSMFEQSDVITAYWHSYIQLKQKIIEPPGQVKPESEIYYHLAQRFGIAQEKLKGRIPAPNDAAVDAWLSEKLSPFPGITLNRLKQGPLLAPGTQQVAFSDFVFPTPSGKIELWSDEAQARWAVPALPEFTEPGFEQDELQNGFYLMTPNTKNRIHSQFGNLSLIKQVAGRAFIHMHPQDVEQLNLRSGQLVRVFNQRGSLNIELRSDTSVPRGCVCMYNGWWRREGGPVNLLSQALETDMGFGAAFHNTIVQVEAV